MNCEPKWKFIESLSHQEKETTRTTQWFSTKQQARTQWKTLLTMKNRNDSVSRLNAFYYLLTYKMQIMNSNKTRY